MGNLAIRFDNVGKLYRLGQVGTGTLSNDLNRWWKTRILGREDPYLRVGETNDRSRKGSSDFVWALQDINFDVYQGEVVGIIGKNGAGKSTLLKLLSMVTAPTTGEISVRGRLASLLEVGTGFHQEMSGRENIYMNGSIMGMTRAEINSRLDAIVDFAGVERYLDTPVKRYSSGMIVRLGFAVAAFLDPEILVVDEVLAVGDAEFQKKAIGKMQDVSRDEGRTVLFVSHNMAAVRSLCNRGIVLDQGKMVFDAGVAEAVEYYLSDSDANEKKGFILNSVKWTKNGLKILRITVNGTEKSQTRIKTNQLSLKVEIEGETTIGLKTDIMLVFKNMDGVPLISYAEGHYKGVVEDILPGSFKLIREIHLPKYLSKGKCYVDLYMHHPMYEFQLKAPHCVEIEIEGSFGDYGRPINSFDSGILGLESME